MHWFCCVCGFFFFFSKIVILVLFFGQNWPWKGGKKIFEDSNKCCSTHQLRRDEFSMLNYLWFLTLYVFEEARVSCGCRLELAEAWTRSRGLQRTRWSPRVRIEARRQIWKKHFSFHPKNSCTSTEDGLRDSDGDTVVESINLFLTQCLSVNHHHHHHHTPIVLHPQSPGHPTPRSGGVRMSLGCVRTSVSHVARNNETAFQEKHVCFVSLVWKKKKKGHSMSCLIKTKMLKSTKGNSSLIIKTQSTLGQQQQQKKACEGIFFFSLWEKINLVQN